jgi:hypothetical protein
MNGSRDLAKQARDDHHTRSSPVPAQFQRAGATVTPHRGPPPPAREDTTMTMTIGWLGAALVLASYAQTNTARLRQINLLASIAMLTFDVTLRIWPSVVLELLLAIVNIRRLTQLRSGAAVVSGEPQPAVLLAVA